MNARGIPPARSKFSLCWSPDVGGVYPIQSWMGGGSPSSFGRTIIPSDGRFVSLVFVVSLAISRPSFNPDFLSFIWSDIVHHSINPARCSTEVHRNFISEMLFSFFPPPPGSTNFDFNCPPLVTCILPVALPVLYLIAVFLLLDYLYSTYLIK